MFKQKHYDPPLVEMETENKQLKREIETLKRENVELRETNNVLKQSLEESVRSTRPQPAMQRGLRSSHSAEFRAGSDTADRRSNSELQQQLNRSIQQLSETRQQLLNVQERLTVAEQVTAATQRRELQQEGAYQNLPSDSVYEELRFDPTQEHVYVRLQFITHTGCIIVFNNVARNLHPNSQCTV